MIGTMLVALASASPLPFASDPAPGIAHSKTWSRNLECERLSTETGSQQYPGLIEIEGPRGDYIERSVVICRQRFVRFGLRPPRDEVILSSLEASVTDLASVAESTRPDLKDRVWVVQSYYPSPAVAAKISFAAKNALMRRGLSISDRAPSLAQTDLELITRLPPDSAYPAACRRYLEGGSMGEGDVLFAVVSRDPRETILHAGLCAGGQWTWLK